MANEKRRLGIGTPCENRWEDLEPRKGGRFCPQCEKTVVDLRRATERQAWDLIDGREGALCVRIRANVEGQAVFRAPPRMPPPSRLAVLAAGAFLAACESGAEAPPEPAPSAIQAEARPIEDPLALPEVQPVATGEEASGSPEAGEPTEPGQPNELAAAMPRADEAETAPNEAQPGPCATAAGATPAPHRRRHRQAAAPAPDSPTLRPVGSERHSLELMGDPFM